MRIWRVLDISKLCHLTTMWFYRQVNNLEYNNTECHYCWWLGNLCRMSRDQSELLDGFMAPYSISSARPWLRWHQKYNKQLDRLPPGTAPEKVMHATCMCSVCLLCPCRVAFFWNLLRCLLIETQSDEFQNRKTSGTQREARTQKQTERSQTLQEEVWNDLGKLKRVCEHFDHFKFNTSYCCFSANCVRLLLWNRRPNRSPKSCFIQVRNLFNFKLTFNRKH